MRRATRAGLPVLCLVGALWLIPAASASAQGTTTTSCTVTTLLLPGQTVQCTTPVNHCALVSAPLNFCFLSANAVASSLAGISISAQAAFTAQEVRTPPVGDPETAVATVVAKCSAAIAVLGGCTAQTPNDHN